jgi:hypothetical protein
VRPLNTHCEKKGLASAVDVQMYRCYRCEDMKWKYTTVA